MDTPSQNIEDMPTTELEALAYRIGKERDNSIRSLNVVESLILQRQQEEARAHKDRAMAELPKTRKSNNSSKEEI